MRRDYFTCVFLGLIAGALTFVCFKPLYFTYGQIIPRDFSLYEQIASFLYALFFIVFLPFFAAFKKKEWINWGLAAYGLLAFFPLWFYPAPELIKGENASMLHILGSLCLRAIYAVMQAPFAALSKYVGNETASSIVYWILPVAVIWPLIFRVVRFYRRAYLSEQLNPMTANQAAPVPVKKSEAPEKPDVLGTVISAPVTAQTPADITRKNKPVEKVVEKKKAPPVEAKKAEEVKEDNSEKRAGVRAPVRPVHIGVNAPEQEKVEALGSGPEKAEKKPEVIQLGAPKPKSGEAIPLGSPKPKSDEAIPLGAPKPKSDEAIPLGSPKPKPDEAIQLGAPKAEPGEEVSVKNVRKAPVRPVHLGAPVSGDKSEQ
jgi:hypothetical protein